MLELRILDRKSSVPCGDLQVESSWSDRYLRGLLLQRVRAHRAAETHAGRNGGELLLQFRGEAFDRWVTVCAGVDDTGLRMPVPIHGVFSTEWDLLLERFRLAYRHWLSRRRLLHRARRRRYPE
ncbi:MAG TPA: hypothetical protein VKA32_02730 [Gammaproteobacteria bacterium]|nr:hypothetical protein [Gammaproteobacteria bacterium]